MKHIIMTAVLICSLIMFSSCKHTNTAAGDPPPAKQQNQTQAKVTKPVNPNNILLNIKKGMTPEEVRNLIGNPQRQSVYETGKRWVPFYYGTDLQRMDWFYGDFGHLTFSINKYSNQKQIHEVHFK